MLRYVCVMLERVGQDLSIRSVTASTLHAPGYEPIFLAHSVPTLPTRPQ